MVLPITYQRGRRTHFNIPKDNLPEKRKHSGRWLKREREKIRGLQKKIPI